MAVQDNRGMSDAGVAAAAAAAAVAAAGLPCRSRPAALESILMVVVVC